jgi:CRISPR-associated protein Cas2
MLVVMSYDISDDRRRLRVSKVLEGYGERVLESVFECDLTTVSLERLLRRVRRLLAPGDRWRCYVLCAGCARRTMGSEARLQLPPTWVV